MSNQLGIQSDSYVLMRRRIYDLLRISSTRRRIHRDNNPSTGGIFPSGQADARCKYIIPPWLLLMLMWPRSLVVFSGGSAITSAVGANGGSPRRITPPPEPGAAGGGTGNKGKVANHQDTLAVNHAPLRPNDYYPCLCARPGMPGRIQICRVGSRTSRFPLIGRNESKKMNDQTCKKIFARQYFRERQASIFAISVVIPHSLPRLGQYRAVSTPFLESRALAY
ncbi:hypothetical protein Fcan01_22493 [Folsomia candida]|uniref:Uncharacterized protein n=1 Tax=Folsomia candida TaxID=158441 RepID=A0A226DB57_FOLCA|nr:hypothetical protein Fcan01_22493 [Folsomia candida]